jgi:hypothetical protein
VFLAGLVSGPVGGFLAERAFGLTAGVGAGMCFLVFVPVFLFLRETPLPRSQIRLHSRFSTQFKSLMRSRTLWHVAVMEFLFQFSPGFQTPLYYYQTNTLKFSSQFIGNLAVVSGRCGLLGALLYVRACRRMHLRPMLALSIAASVGTTLLYLLYRSRSAAIGIEAANGFVCVATVIPPGQLRLSVPIFSITTRVRPDCFNHTTDGAGSKQEMGAGPANSTAILPEYSGEPPIVRLAADPPTAAIAAPGCGPARCGHSHSGHPRLSAPAARLVPLRPTDGDHAGRDRVGRDVRVRRGRHLLCRAV